MFRRQGRGVNHGVIDFAIANYRAQKLFPGLVDKEEVFKGLHYILGCHPHSKLGDKSQNKRQTSIGDIIFHLM